MNQLRRLFFLTVALTAAGAAACGDSEDSFRVDVPEVVGDAVAYGIWSPGPQDTCSAAIHDSPLCIRAMTTKSSVNTGDVP